MKQTELFPEPPPRWEVAADEDRLVARVVLNRPVDIPFDYLVPDLFRGKIQPGQRVRVPFGRGDQIVTGYVVEVARPAPATVRAVPRSGRDAGPSLKTVHSLVDPQPLLSQRMLSLTRWIADHYLCAWGQVLDCVIPAGVKKLSGTREALFLDLDPDVVVPANANLPAKQRRVLEILREAGAPLSSADLEQRAECGSGPIQSLRKRGWIRAVRQRVMSPDENAAPDQPKDQDLVLNDDQRRVVDRVLETLRAKEHRTFVLHGVTGSGKTEVYIRAIREVVGYGRQAIVLVPEISLTPQTIRRFRSRFDNVAVLHSHLTDTERHREWREIAEGDVQVIVGARSAVFAPAPRLGLIIIDEEHETSFKQDKTPRYHAREVARKRAELESIPLLLGSATPSLESWLRAKTGEYELLRMPRRVSGLSMPPVIIVDIRNDPYCARGQAIGRSLGVAMKNALEHDGQVILFLNLRGFSPSLWCPKCGEVAKCPNCDISLSWHADIKAVICHFCDFQQPPPQVCPSCAAPGLKYLGTGTQRLEQEVRAKFPTHACLRMDSDAMRKRGAHDEALERFRHGEVRILLGTQMISKGLDFPDVTLVGVVQADTLLHQPDLRAGERTFQLVAQVAGRTGRGGKGGRVVVQTGQPEEPAIILASRHDFVAFATAELEHRRQLKAPPFEKMVRVILRSEDEALVQQESRRLVDALASAVRDKANGIRILGPAPAPTMRLEGYFRFHFQMTCPNLEDALALWREVGLPWKLASGVEMAVDVDPLNLR